MRFDTRPPYAQFSSLPDGLLLTCSYSQEVNDAVKALPSTARRPHIVNERFRGWVIDPRHAPAIVQAVERYIGVALAIPTTSAAAAPMQTKLFKVEYIGRCKATPTGNLARGCLGSKDWSLLLPEAVLRAWFGDDLPSTPAAAPVPQSLYGVLGLTKATDGPEIKAAYKRMARQWHPDVCREPDANERFVQIQHAYAILGDLDKRRKYDVGMQLAERAAQMTTTPTPRFAAQISDSYRSPLRCGSLLVEGQQVIAGFQVSAIKGWQDITDSEGRTMVSSWPKDGIGYEIAWF